MKQIQPYEQVPLTTDEKDMLLTVYESRLRYLFIVYLFLVIMGVWPMLFNVYYWKYSILDWFVTAVMKYGVVETAIIGTGIYFLNTRILPFKRDALSGVKEKIPYTIMRKEYFPLTSQYYFGFDDPDYLHHEVDEDTYNKCNEGDTMYVYRGIKSKYVFELNGRFSIV
jgi:hypothetical protein